MMREARSFTTANPLNWVNAPARTCPGLWTGRCSLHLRKLAGAIGGTLVQQVIWIKSSMATIKGGVVPLIFKSGVRWAAWIF